MTRKFWMIVLTVAIAFVFAACNTEKADAPEPASPGSGVQVVKETAPSVPESADMDAAQAEPVPSPVVITVNNLAAAGLTKNGAVSMAEPESNSAHNAIQESLSVEHLPRVTDGQTIVTMTDIRQGPGINYDQLGTLQLGQLVDVVAITPHQDWVLIKSSGLIGWVLADNMALFDSPDVLPAVMSSAPDGNIPVGEIAPIFAVSGEGEPDA